LATLDYGFGFYGIAGTVPSIVTGVTVMLFPRKGGKRVCGGVTDGIRPVAEVVVAVVVAVEVAVHHCHLSRQIFLRRKNVFSLEGGEERGPNLRM
jgi:hypothetical protein